MKLVIGIATVIMAGLLSSQTAYAFMSPMAGLTTEELVDLAWTFERGGSGNAGTSLDRCRSLPATSVVRLRGDAQGYFDQNKRQHGLVRTQVVQQSQATLEALYTASVELHDVVGLRKKLATQIRRMDTGAQRLAGRLDRLFTPRQSPGSATGFARSFAGIATDTAEVVSSADEIISSTNGWFDSSTEAVRAYKEQVETLTELVMRQRAIARSLNAHAGRYAFFEICVRFGRLERPEEMTEAEDAFRQGIGDATGQTVPVFPEDYARERSATRRTFDVSCYVDCSCIGNIIDREPGEYTLAAFDFFARAPMQNQRGVIACTDLTGETGFARKVTTRHPVPNYTTFVQRLRSISTNAVDQCPNLHWVDDLGRPSSDCWGGSRQAFTESDEFTELETSEFSDAQGDADRQLHSRLDGRLDELFDQLDSYMKEVTSTVGPERGIRDCVGRERAVVNALVDHLELREQVVGRLQNLVSNESVLLLLTGASSSVVLAQQGRPLIAEVLRNLDSLNTIVGTRIDDETQRLRVQLSRNSGNPYWARDATNRVLFACTGPRDTTP